MMDGFVAKKSPPVPVVALAGWVVPGLGYFLIGEKARGLVTGLTILLLFVGGIFLGGIRIIDPPGYAKGQKELVGGSNQWTLTAMPMAALMDKPWFIPQLLAGPITIGGSWLSLAAAKDVDMPHAHIRDVATLYTAVAGMLNLFVIIDASHRATRGKP